MRRQIYKQFREDLPDLTYQDLKDLRLPSLIRDYYRVRDLNRICSCYLKSTLCKKLREQEES